MLQNNNLSEELVSIYRAWATLVTREKGVEDSLFILVDDLAPQSIVPVKFDNELEVLNALRNVEKKMQPKDSYTHHKVRNSIAYLESFMVKPELNVLSVMERGAPVFRVSEERVQNLFSRMSEIENQIGNEGMARLNKKVQGDEVPGIIKSTAKKYCGTLVDNIGMKPISWRLKETHSEKPWRMVATFSTIDDTQELWVNTNRNISYEYWELYALSLHEVCGHLFHLNHLKLAYESRIEKEHLCIAIHGIDSFYTETVAQCIFFYLTKATDSLIAEYCFLRFHLEFILKNNTILDYIEGVGELDVAVEGYCSFFPGDREKTLAYFKKVISDPFFSAQILNYVGGYEVLCDKMEEFPESTIKYLISEPRTFDDIKNFSKDNP